MLRLFDKLNHGKYGKFIILYFSDRCQCMGCTSWCDFPPPPSCCWDRLWHKSCDPPQSYLCQRTTEFTCERCFLGQKYVLERQLSQKIKFLKVAKYKNSISLNYKILWCCSRIFLIINFKCNQLTSITYVGISWHRKLHRCIWHWDCARAGRLLDCKGMAEDIVSHKPRCR